MFTYRGLWWMKWNTCWYLHSRAVIIPFPLWWTPLHKIANWKLPVGWRYSELSQNMYSIADNPIHWRDAPVFALNRIAFIGENAKLQYPAYGQSRPSSSWISQSALSSFRARDWRGVGSRQATSSCHEYQSNPRIERECQGDSVLGGEKKSSQKLLCYRCSGGI